MPPGRMQWYTVRTTTRVSKGIFPIRTVLPLITDTVFHAHIYCWRVQTAHQNSALFHALDNAFPTALHINYMITIYGVTSILALNALTILLLFHAIAIYYMVGRFSLYLHTARCISHRGLLICYPEAHEI